MAPEHANGAGWKVAAAAVGIMVTAGGWASSALFDDFQRLHEGMVDVVERLAVVETDVKHVRSMLDNHETRDRFSTRESPSMVLVGPMPLDD
jgi:hypothetical protein